MSKERHSLPLRPGAPGEITVCVFCDSGQLRWLSPTGNDMPLCSFFEQTPYEVLIEGLGGRPVSAWLAGEERTSELHCIGGGAYWALNWGDFAGLSRLCLEVDGQVVLDLPVEVRSKLRSDEHYERLLDELAEYLAAIIFSVRAPVAVPAWTTAQQRGSLYLSYLVIRCLLQPAFLPAAFAQVSAQPHSRLTQDPVWVDVSQARTLSYHTLSSIASRGAPMARTPPGILLPEAEYRLQGLVPARLPDVRAHLDFDTPENRFVRHLLQLLAWYTSTLEQQFAQIAGSGSADKDMASQIAQQCGKWGLQIARWQQAAFLSQVGEMRVYPASSQVLRRKEGYRELRDYYHRLLLCPRVRWEELEELLRIPVKDVPTLYEYWCLFALADALKSAGGQPNWRNVVDWRDGLWEIKLKEGAEIPCGPFTLLYNHPYRWPDGSYSLALRPDYTVEWGGQRWLFDAKYRLEWRDWETATSEDSHVEKEQSSFKRADLYKMHAYRDAIRGAEAVFILYPGSEFVAYGVNGQRYRRPEELPPGFSGVGAVPLLPGRTRMVESVVKALLARAG